MRCKPDFRNDVIVCGLMIFVLGTYLSRVFACLYARVHMFVCVCERERVCVCVWTYGRGACVCLHCMHEQLSVQPNNMLRLHTLVTLVASGLIGRK